MRAGLCVGGPRRVTPVSLFGLASCLISAVCLSDSVRAQDLPVVGYTSADGLVHDEVHRIELDPHGFLWIAAAVAIARFDGERFTSYGLREGLDPGTGLNDLRFDGRGDLWIATNGAGIFRLDRRTLDASARFLRLPVGDGRASNRVNTLQVLDNGQVWAGTDAGLFTGTPAGEFRRVSLPGPGAHDTDTPPVFSLAASPSTLWVGTRSGAFRCDLSSAQCVSARPGAVYGLLLDRRNRLWIANQTGIERRMLGENSVLGQPEFLAAGLQVRRMFLGSETVLVTTADRRVISIDEPGARVLFTATDALFVNDVIEDASGNVWVATTAGLVGIRRQGITLFSTHQRLRPPHLLGLRRGAGGQPYVLSEDEWVHRIDGDRVTGVHLRLPKDVRRSSWRTTAAYLDGVGDVWLGTSSGLYRFTSPPFSATPVSITHSQVFTTTHGLAGQHVAEIFEDSNKDIWIAHVPDGPETLTIWRRRSSRFERLGVADGLPASSQLQAFFEDRHGAVWARLREGGLVRIRAGKGAVFGAAHGLPPFAFATLIDGRGHLWVSGTDSLVKVTGTAADVISAAPVLTGLSTPILSLAEAGSGRLFLGSYTGLHVFDPARKTFQRLSAFEGIPSGRVDALLTDRDGTLLATPGRRLIRVALPKPASPDRPLQCLLSTVRVGGLALPLPEAGLQRIDAPDIQPARNLIEIEFVGLSSRLSEPLAYEYRLEGVNDEWVRAPDRRVTYAGLASGRYSFEARATGSDGVSVSAPAVVTFRVLPPWYQRSWFVVSAIAAVLLVAYAAHRMQLAQVVRTERLRSRIATDLHDDIGASLSQIAILAEVARRRAGDREGALASPLSSIATTSRDLVDAMSDIVWAINPRTDSLTDLSRRMHRFAEETLGGADIALKFSAPSNDADLKIGSDLRRELYLILKESVNNITRHSGATEAVVDLSLVRHELRLEISDNGRGFDPGLRMDGNGVASMRKRAAAFGGTFAVDSAPGRGTRVSLRAQLRGQPRRSYAST